MGWLTPGSVGTVVLVIAILQLGVPRPLRLLAVARARRCSSRGAVATHPLSSGPA